MADPRRPLTSAQARKQRPVFQDEMTLEEEDGGDMMAMTTTTGDVVTMQSGSPVFGWWPKGPYAVGVVSGVPTESRTLGAQ
jgi:hypothetical protein